MSSRVAWLKPVSKFVLEVGPPLSAMVIGGYVLAGVLNRPAVPAVAIAPTAAASVSGEELTAMIQTAHAAALAAAKPPKGQPAKEASAASPTKAEPPKRVAKLPLPAPAPRAAVVSAVAKPSAPLVEATAAAQTPAATPASPLVIAAEPPRPRRSWYGRAWGAVAGWGGAVAHTTRLDDAAGFVVEAPVAAARAGRRSLSAVIDLADAVIPDPRR